METLEKTNELITVVEASGLEEKTAVTLKEKFMPFFEQAEDWKRKAEALIVTDAAQVREMKMAREARLALKEIRVNADKTRKALKEDSLRYGKAVQGVYNVIEFLIAPIEKHLQEQEDFAVIQEARRKAEIKAKREIEIQPYSEFVPVGLDFGSMSEEDFQKTFNGAKLQLQQRQEAAAKAELERIEREKAEAAERERIRIENERLKAEAAEKEKALAAERARVEKERLAAEAIRRAEQEKADALLEAQRKAAAKAKADADKKIKAAEDEKRRIAAELKAKQDEEAAAEKARVLAAKKAQAAPDKVKLIELANVIDALALPELKSEDAKIILQSTTDLLAKVSKYIREKSSEL